MEQGDRGRSRAATPGFAERCGAARSRILNDERQIALPDEVQGEFVTNFWRDAQHPRGLWRISPRAAYLAGRPEWRVLIDVDALGRAREPVLGLARRRLPRARISPLPRQLSPGGGDADVMREFDIPTGRFVEGGFTLPEAKTSVTWLDPTGCSSSPITARTR